MPEYLPRYEPVPRHRNTWREWAALTLTVGFGLSIWHVDHVGVAAHAAADQATSVSLENRVIGFRNRAAICDFILEFGGVQPAQCADKDIAPYRDPHIKASSGERANTTVLLCQILDAVHSVSKRCSGVT